MTKSVGTKIAHLVGVIRSAVRDEIRRSKAGLPTRGDEHEDGLSSVRRRQSCQADDVSDVNSKGEAHLLGRIGEYSVVGGPVHRGHARTVMLSRIRLNMDLDAVTHVIHFQECQTAAAPTSSGTGRTDGRKL